MYRPLQVSWRSRLIGRSRLRSRDSLRRRRGPIASRGERREVRHYRAASAIFPALERIESAMRCSFVASTYFLQESLWTRSIDHEFARNRSPEDRAKPINSIRRRECGAQTQHSEKKRAGTHLWLRFQLLPPLRPRGASSSAARRSSPLLSPLPPVSARARVIGAPRPATKRTGLDRQP